MDGVIAEISVVAHSMATDPQGSKPKLTTRARLLEYGASEFASILVIAANFEVAINSCADAKAAQVNGRKAATAENNNRWESLTPSFF